MGRWIRCGDKASSKILTSLDLTMPIALCASTVIASEKSSISTYRKSTTRFPTSHR